MYLEDVDLNWRAQLAGWQCIYAPDAVVYHHLSATGGGVLASYYVGRNTLWTHRAQLPGRPVPGAPPRHLAHAAAHRPARPCAPGAAPRRAHGCAANWRRWCAGPPGAPNGAARAITPRVSSEYIASILTQEGS